MTPDQVNETLQTIAEGFKSWTNAPIMHWPSEAELAYKDVFFPSECGVTLEGCFIPRAGSNKIIIANHPRWFNRSGLPSHLEPWSRFGGATGNDFEVNFIPDYKILHDAGYNVLAYHKRNFGHSGAANAGVFSVGRYESRDVIGSLQYIRSREDTRDMTIGLFSRCVGGNATLFAMQRRLGAFNGVRCMVSPQPLSNGVAKERALERLNIPATHFADLNGRVRLQTSFTIDQFSPVPWAKSVTFPPSSIRCVTTPSRGRATSRRYSTTCRSRKRSCTGSRARRCALSAIPISSANPRRYSTGLRDSWRNGCAAGSIHGRSGRQRASDARVAHCIRSSQTAKSSSPLRDSRRAA